VSAIPAANDPVAQIAVLAPQAQAELAGCRSQIATLQAARRRKLGVNLEAISYWSRGLVFADAMLQAQNFWQGADPAGNPTVDQGVLVFSSCTPSMAGSYSLVANGQPTLQLQASFGAISGQTYDASTDTTTATIAVTAEQLAADPQLQIRIGNVGPGRVRNAQLWRPGVAPGSCRFYAPFVALLAPFDVVRFMPALAINGSQQQKWSDRALPTDRNFTLKGMSYEDCLDLAKLAGKTPWLNVPAMADADYLAELIALIQRNTTGPVFLEWSNELWNWAMPEWQFVLQASKQDPRLAFDGQTDPNVLAWRWMAQKAVDIAQAACAAYGVSDVRKCPIRPVFCGQWGNPQVLQTGVNYIKARYGSCRKLIHSLGIAPYGTLSPALLNRINSGDATVTEQAIVADWLANGIENASLANAGTAAFVQLADAEDLGKWAYEFGADWGQGQGDLQQKIAAAHDPAIAAAVTAYVGDWWAAGADGANWFALTCADTASGEWGLTDDTLNANTPKMQAAAAAAMGLLS
jgi:hypothetical protein